MRASAKYLSGMVSPLQFVLLCWGVASQISVFMSFHFSAGKHPMLTVLNLQPCYSKAVSVVVKLGLSVCLYHVQSHMLSLIYRLCYVHCMEECALPETSAHFRVTTITLDGIHAPVHAPSGASYSFRLMSGSNDTACNVRKHA